MKWNRSEIDRLSPILEQLSFDLAPVDGKHILVLCSAAGEVALRLVEMMETGMVTGLELDQELLELSRRSAHEMGLEAMVEFSLADLDHIPMPDASFDALVSEFIVYPTSSPTEIGQSEMARVLAPGGRMILTDVIVTTPLPPQVHQEFTSLGLDYLCAATQNDFQNWMNTAGLINVELLDLTPTVRAVWEDRSLNDPAASRQQAYSYLLDNQKYSLGKGLFYIYIRGDKPKTIP
jgi:cyclopropane fatty-acyl-phospholipid synthase-like methyltransferase